MQTEMLDLNGHPFFIRRWGSPDLPPLLLLHGFPEYGGAWGTLASLLSNHFHCIAPDQRGYGQSWAPDDIQSYAAKALISDMIALIDQIGAPVSLMGHDWGAAVAYGLTIARPDLITRLIIANGVHPIPFQRALAAGGAQSEASQYINALRRPNSQDHLAANDFERMRALFSAKMDSRWMTDDLFETYKTEWARGGRLKTMIHWYRATPLRVADPGHPITDLPDMPPETFMITPPHLLLWGEQDTALLPVSTQGLESFAPNLTRVTFPDADHWIIHQEPQAIARTVLDWVATH